MPPIASFDEEKPLASVTQEPRGMSAWLVKKGLASNIAAANVTLVALVVVCVALGAFIAFRGLSNGEYLAGKELNQYIQKMKSVQKAR